MCLWWRARMCPSLDPSSRLSPSLEESNLLIWLVLQRFPRQHDHSLVHCQNLDPPLLRLCSQSHKTRLPHFLDSTDRYNRCPHNF